MFHFYKQLILSILILSVSGCMFEDGKITVTHFGGGSDGIALAKVTSVSIVNDQLVVNGTDLSGVTGVRITGPNAFNENFSIESKTGNNLIANGLSNVAFVMNGLFNLVLTDVYGSATFQVTFTLQDGAVTASKLHDMGAGVGQVLKFDGTNWGPSDLGALTYAGTWDSATATAPNVAPSAGEYYIVDGADTAIDIGDGSGARNFAVGDWLVYNDITSMWDKIDNATNVTSFNNRSGPVVPVTNDYTWAQINKTSSVLSEIADIDAPAGDGSDTGKVLKWNNATSRWELGDDLSGGGAGSVTSTEISDGAIVDADVNGAAAIAQSKIANLTTDLAAKVPLAGGAMTGDLTVPNLITSGNVDGVDISTLYTSVGTNTTNIGNNATAISNLDTDDVNEGTALYFTDARAKASAVVNSTAGTETDQAASVASMKTYVASEISSSGALLADGTVAMTGNLDLGNNKLRLKSDNVNYVELIAPNTLAATYTLTMPVDDGTVGQVLSTDGSGALSWANSTSGTVTNVTGTAPIVSSGGATPAISIAQANGATDGFLDSADWTNFNNKQNALPTGGTTAQYLRGDLTLATLQDDVRSTLLTGYSSGAGTVAATDTIIQAVNKLDGNITANSALISGLDTDDVSEGSNLYFTDARAKASAVINSTAGSETDQAASVAAMKSYVAANSGNGDITDGGNTNAATVTIGTNDANSLALETNNSTAMTILSGGNVGIGTTSPDTKLHVGGTLKIADGGETCTVAGEAGMIRYNTGSLEYCNGSAWLTLGINGSGLTSFNGETGGTQTLGTGATGTAPAFISGANTHTLNIPLASGAGVTSGTISKTDYDSFTAKQAAITTGATTQYLRGDLSLSTFGTDVIGSLITGYTSGAGTVAATDTVLQAIQKLDGNIAAVSVPSDTDGLSEGATNLYFTDARARAAAVLNVTTGTETDQAASVAAMKAYVTSNSGSGDLTDGGNTTAATVVVGTNDANSLQLETNNAVAMTVLSGGNVGIGTSTPSSKLTVLGNGTALNVTHTNPNYNVALGNLNSAGNPFVMFRGTNSTGNTIVRSSTAAPMGFLYGGTTYSNDKMSLISGNTGVGGGAATLTDIMTWTSSGNVGIGTTSPLSLLDVYSSLNSTLRLSSGSGQARLVLGNRDATGINNPSIVAASGGALYLGGGNNWNSATGGTIDYSMTVADGGNVGIGTTSPSQKLDVVNGNISVTNSTSYTEIRSANNGGSASIRQYNTTSGTATSDGVSLDDASAWYAVNASKTLFFGAPYYFMGTGANGTSMFVGTTGNVGIGTTSPQEKLHINGNIRLPSTSTIGNGFGEQIDISGPGDTIDIKTESTTRIHVSRDGEVGVGTSSPNNQLHIKDTVSFDPNSHTGTLFVEGKSEISAVGAYGGSIVFSRSTGTNRAAAIVAIEDNNDADVAALTFFTKPSQVSGPALIERMRIKSENGYVGIGTTSPTAKLSVNGTANKTGGGSWATFSDIRLKTVTGSFKKGLDELMKLDVIRYNYNDDNPLGLANDKEHIGFIAQEIEKVIPEAISYTKDGYLMIDNDPIIWTLLNGTKELKENMDMFKAMQSSTENSQNRAISSLADKVDQLQKENDEMKLIICEIKPGASFCK